MRYESFFCVTVSWVDTRRVGHGSDAARLKLASIMKFKWEKI